MKSDRTIMTLAIIGSLVMANVIAVKLFGRLDLTADGQYTLSTATEDTLRRLTDPVTVKAFFSKDVPPPFSTNGRYVQDLLEEYYAHSDGYFRYEFVDPMEEETQEDKEKKKEVKRDIFGRQVREPTSIEQELQGLGIPPVQVQAREEDKLEVKRAYMGLAIKYGDNTEVIPVVKDTSTLEYDLTSLIRKLTRSKTPKIAFVRGPESIEPMKDLGRIHGLLTQVYDVTSIDMTTDTTIADDVDAIVVLGSKTPFSPDAQRSIDGFVMSGRPAAFLVDGVRPELATLTTEETDHGLTDMLKTYGVEIKKGLALDAECATINVQRQQGFMRIAQPVPYPYMPFAKSTEVDHPLTRGMGQMGFPFMSPLNLVANAESGVKGEVVISTSEKGWLETAPYNLDPFQRWTKDMVGDQKAQPLLATLKGSIKSHFGAPAAVAAEGGAEQASDARVLVAGGSSFLTDQFLTPQTQALVLNLVDWLLSDEALLAVRARGLAAAPIDDDLADATRATVKYGNIFGLPLLFALFGVLRWRRREARRARATL